MRPGRPAAGVEAATAVLTAAVIVMLVRKPQLSQSQGRSAWNDDFD